MRIGRRERIGLLTKNQRDLARHAHERINQLHQKREEIKKKGREYSEKYSKESSELQKISFELNYLSHAIGRLEDDVDRSVSEVVGDLDIILSSEILKSWVARNISTVNSIAQKLAQLNATDISPFKRWHKNRRMIMTRSRPQRYWLNENFFDNHKKKSKFISYVSLDYVLQGIKRSWNRKYGNLKINVRDTLREALELEEKYPRSELQKTRYHKIVPRSEKDAITIVQIYDIVEKIKKSNS